MSESDNPTKPNPPFTKTQNNGKKRGRPQKPVNPKGGSSKEWDVKKEVRERAEADLIAFIRLVAPWRLIAHVHEDLCNWWTRQDAKQNQLLLLPRDHAKSWFVAMRCVWRIVKNPTIRILYLSSTSNLAEKQLKLIKDILTSDVFTYYLPEFVNKDEGKREKWTLTEIAVDHPARERR